MVFHNLQVDPDSLPSIDDLTFVDLDPRYARLRFGIALGLVSVGLILLIAEALIIHGFFGSVPWGAFVLGMVLILFALVVLPLYRYKEAKAKGYAVREHDVTLRSGLFWKSEIIQPIRRIQHIELTRGPVEKRVGLANIVLYGAGSTGATFTIPGLSLRTAVRLRRVVLGRVKQ